MFIFIRQKSNYLGGDIISGMVATGIYKKRKFMHFSISEQTESLYWETGISFCVEQVLRDLRWKAEW